MKEETLYLWQSRAQEAQHTFDSCFWNADIRMYNIESPCPDGECNTIFHYWWMAHAVENLTDAYLRTQEPLFKSRLAQIYDGLLERNGGVWPNELYDDMEWMAIAWLRAYHATREERYLHAALTLWDDIQTGWNDHMGGGIAWRKQQLDYKNTPANAPAVILAARLYQAFGRDADLEWAVKVYDWQTRHLVDPDTGFVWDGINRTGDGKIDMNWKFTYCQGVYIGAALELYRITGDQAYLRQAVRTAHAAIAQLVDPVSGMLPLEGPGDGALFKGIFVRYLTDLLTELKLSPDKAEPTDRSTLVGSLLRNANSLWENARREQMPLFGNSWARIAEGKIQLSAQLSGVHLLEMMAVLETLYVLEKSERS
ncbi:glycoside hydrolase family 76 protein [Paenibacillus allorhizosphaerae]|uniref:Glycosyl hydrolase n=1 Tax=Paenibacillus allorhizosphaerae TaxID=2849866 RepID=A0ABM8VQL6_9BACL|nr:glycoside hydrolase family 76 protein [Paenibacillus allorhizosphaerae]CAG7654322.1 hypothetical protein PAECIP111802_05738 [Paenibacillus allorhizosphaerae]